MSKNFFLPFTVKKLLSEAELVLQAGQEVSLNAWVRSKRDSKNYSFLNLNDGSCVKGIQAVVNLECRQKSVDFEQIDNGASIRLKGVLQASEGSGQEFEIVVSEINLIGAAPQEEYPLQKKRHSFEFLREISHLRARSNSLGSVFRVRNTLSMLIHEFFQKHEFFNVHTPVITVSDAEGAGEMFQLESTRMSGPDAKKQKHFFGREAFLTVSGQLEGEAFAHSHSRIYTFGPTFRAEESNTARHLAEFWMVEPEVAFMDLSGLMELAEAFIRYLIEGVLERCTEELALFDKWIESGLIDSLTAVVNSPTFLRCSYTTAVELIQEAVSKGRKFEYPLVWGNDLQTEHERWLTEEHFKQPVIVYDYPAAGKAFYMKQNEDGKTVRGMDVLVPRLGEIIGGSQREDDYEKLAARMAADDMILEDYQWYLDLRRFGGTPHSGFGLGFERMLMYVTGMKNIRDVIPFPRAIGQAY